MVEAHFHLTVEPCTIVQIDGWSAALEPELSRQLGSALPATCGEAALLRQWLAIRIAPRRFWLIGNGISTPPPPSIDPEIGSSVSLGESRMRLRMRGASVFDILGACMAVDWDWPQAAAGGAIQTGFHHVPVLALRTAADACDLLVPRSFAQSLSEWIIDAAAPYLAREATEAAE